jgi:hypothetical protein
MSTTRNQDLALTGMETTLVSCTEHAFSIDSALYKSFKCFVDLPDQLTYPSLRTHRNQCFAITDLPEVWIVVTSLCKVNPKVPRVPKRWLINQGNGRFPDVNEKFEEI